MADTPPQDNVFTRKIGPLPMWAWVAIIAVPLLGYGLLKKQPKSTTGTGTGSTTDASQVPQFVNQTYTTVQPPLAPTNATPPDGHPGPPGTAPPPRPEQASNPYGGIRDASGNVYTYITSPAESQLLQSEGVTVYAKTGANTFVPYQQAPPGGNYPLFQKLAWRG